MVKLQDRADEEIAALRTEHSHAMDALRREFAASGGFGARPVIAEMGGPPDLVQAGISQVERNVNNVSGDVQKWRNGGASLPIRPEKHALISSLVQQLNDEANALRDDIQNYAQKSSVNNAGWSRLVSRTEMIVNRIQ